MQLNGTAERINAESYPVTTEELIAKHGDHEIEHQGGTERLREVLERTESEVHYTPDDVVFSIYSGVSGDAVGRRGYCDRDPTPPGVPREQLSF